jgi:hypothetical protein
MDALLEAKKQIDHLEAELKTAKVELGAASVEFVNAQKQHMAEHNLTTLPSSLEVAVHSGTENAEHGNAEQKYDRIVWQPSVTSKGGLNRAILYDSIKGYFALRGMSAVEIATETADLTSYIWRSRPERTKTDTITFKLPSKKRRRINA